MQAFLYYDENSNQIEYLLAKGKELRKATWLHTSNHAFIVASLLRGIQGCARNAAAGALLGTIAQPVCGKWRMGRRCAQGAGALCS